VTKHVVPVNLAEIRYTVHEIFDSQTKNELELIRAKDVLPEHKPHTSRRHRALPSPRHPPAATELCRLLLPYGARLTMHCQGDDSAVFRLFVPCDYDL